MKRIVTIEDDEGVHIVEVPHPIVLSPNEIMFTVACAILGAALLLLLIVAMGIA